MSWLSGTEYIDSLVKDYLKFRGFNSTVKVLESDLKSDKDKGFRVDKILQQLLLYISTYDIVALKQYWNHLNSTFFCRFVKGYENTIKRFETSLYRLYVVRAYQNSKQRELQIFFQWMTSDFEDTTEWKDWYILPYLQSPETNPTFAPYFTRQWAETYLVSLHNLLASLFSCMPVPELVNACIDDGERILKLEKENEMLRRKEVNNEFNFKSLEGIDPPRYVESMGNLGSLANQTQARNQSKKRPIFEFKTKYSTGNSSPKDIEYTEKKSKSQEDKINYVASFDNTSMTSSPKLSTSKLVSQSSKENILTNKMTKFEEERRALLGSKKKRDPIISGTTTTVASSQPSIVPTEEASIGAVISIDKHPKIGIDEQQQISVSPSNNVEISYESNIVLKQTSLEKEMKNSGFSNTAVNDVVSSHHFVNNLHKLSLGEPSQTEKRSLDTSNILGNEILPSSIPTTAIQPFLLLSKEVFLEHHSSILQCKFDENGTTVGSLDAQGVVKVWKNSPRISTLASVMMNSPIRCLEWCKKPVDILLLGTVNGTIRLFDTIRSVTCEDVTIEDSQIYITNLRSHPSGTSFITSSAVSPVPEQRLGNGILTVWDIKSSRVRMSHRIIKDRLSEITCIEYNHNGNLLIAGDSIGNIALYDMKTFTVIHLWNAHRGRVCSLQFSHDETLVYSVGSDALLLAWSLNQFSNQPTIFHFADRNKLNQKDSSFVLDPEGKNLLMPQGAKGVIYKIENATETLAPVLTLPEHKSPVTAVDWTATNACGHCLTGSSDGKIQMATLLVQN
uniref:WD repeat-containing protein 91-like n=1 Tax=Styela clava TaxID=7725 RepID=UPI00193AD3E1|nr:WD repeat-containing protein 91-like [Styela clava]